MVVYLVLDLCYMISFNLQITNIACTMSFFFSFYFESAVQSWRNLSTFAAKMVQLELDLLEQDGVAVLLLW